MLAQRSVVLRRLESAEDLLEWDALISRLGRGSKKGSEVDRHEHPS